MSRTRIFVASILVLALAGPTIVSSQSLAFAQEPPSPQNSKAPGVHEPHREGRDRVGNLLVKEEEGEADPSAVFKHSPSVRWISRKTGLSIDATYWLCVVLNFIVILAVVWVVLKKVFHLPALFRNRVEDIQRRLEEARKNGEDARRRLAEVEARLSRLDVEIEQMRREAEASASHEEQRVLGLAEEERRRIVDSAEQEIARAANAARRELKAYAAELGVSLAEKKIRIQESTDQKLVREFAARLGRNGN